MGFWKDIWAVIQRELLILVNRPLYLLGTVVPMVFCMVFCLTFFRDGLPHDLPIAVALLAATGKANCPGLADYALVGELALSGEIRRRTSGRLRGGRRSRTRSAKLFSHS